MTMTTDEETEPGAPASLIEEMLQVGAHVGHPAKRWHPRMAPYIYRKHNKTHIIDLRQTVALLLKACKFIEDKVAEGGKVLMVGTKPQAKGPVLEYAERADTWYVTERWLGGMLTNFDTIDKRIKELIHLESDFAKNEVSANTKREEVKIKTKLDRLSKFFGGMKQMDRLPDVLFVVDIVAEEIAIKEARKKGIPCVSIVDTNCDPQLVDYPIPCNDNSARTISLIIGHVTDAIMRGSERFKESEELRMAAELEQEKRERELREKAQREAAERQNRMRREAKAQARKDGGAKPKAGEAGKGVPGAGKKPEAQAAAGKKDAADKAAAKPKPEVKSEAKPEAKSEAKPEAKGDAGGGAKADKKDAKG